MNNQCEMIINLNFLAIVSNQIDLSNLSAGMYFLTVEDKHNKKTIKIIKQ